MLFFEFKYNFEIMQLRLRPKSSHKLISNKFIIKVFLLVSVFFLVIFLLDKIEIPAPSKKNMLEISNDKLITIK